MLDAICNAIPEWQSATDDLREIRSDVVCIFENVESVLQALLAQKKSVESTTPFVSHSFLL